MRLQKTYAKSVWLSKLKAKVNLEEQGSLPSMSLLMWKTVMWFFFFSMIKRMLLQSKSMLSSNLCEIWDLILNESIMSLLDSDEFRQLLVVYVRRNNSVSSGKTMIKDNITNYGKPKADRL